LSCSSTEAQLKSENAPSSKANSSPVASPSVRSEPTADEVSDATADPDEDERIEDDKGDDEKDLDTEPSFFHGYRCTDDCSGHEAGYKWAEEHDIDDPEKCGGRSQSFIEGCRSWADENH